MNELSRAFTCFHAINFISQAWMLLAIMIHLDAKQSLKRTSHCCWLSTSSNFIRRYGEKQPIEALWDVSQLGFLQSVFCVRRNSSEPILHVDPGLDLESALHLSKRTRRLNTEGISLGQQTSSLLASRLLLPVPFDLPSHRTQHLERHC